MATRQAIQQQRDPRLHGVERAVTDALDQDAGDPVERILDSVNRIVDQAHAVALKQCVKAREAIDKACHEAMDTLDLVEKTIDAKRTGTSEQLGHYLQAVRAATVAADDVNTSTVNAIGAIRDTIKKVADQVRALPSPTMPPAPVLAAVQQHDAPEFREVDEGPA